MKRAAEVPTSLIHSDTKTVSSDLSILSKPIKTSVNGLNEARKAYEDGTDEVRNLLSNECDIVYECKVCRALFRSIANFISHKRVYCISRHYGNFHNGKGFHNDGKGDFATIVQENFIATAKNGKNSEKNLSSIVDRLLIKQKTSRTLSDFYEQVNNKLQQDAMLQQSHVLHLDVVPESNVAVYQTVKSSKDDVDSIKAEVIEIQQISDQISGHTVLGPDGKIIDPSDLPDFPDDHEQLAQPFDCEICNCKFATEKTLKLHIETKHMKETEVYFCVQPSCSKTFLQVGQVIRHLTNDHKKSMRRVRLMRDSILKRRTRIDEVQVKGPSRELARLQSDKERTDSQNKAWLDNLEDIENGSKNICLFCGRQFDRRAVLLSHHKVCQQKKKPNTRISLTKKVMQESVSSSWNDREFDDSSNSNSNSYSNSNSLDDVPMEVRTLPPFKDKSKAVTTKNETNVLKNEPEEAESAIAPTLNRRRKNRSLKATLIDETNQSDDDKSLNMGWTAEEMLKKEERASPINHTNVPNSNGNNSLCDVEIETEEVTDAKEEKRTRITNTSSRKTHASETKPKLTSSHCKYCFKKFSNASNLRRHITMSHFGPKNFTCNLCTFRGRRKSDILGHMRTKHEHGSERTAGALKFDTVDDKPTPKPLSQGSFSRRKDKHTEVLQDDQEEIYIDSETFVLGASTDQFKPDQSHENSNVDNLVDDTNKTNSKNLNDISSRRNSNSKRKGRPKADETIDRKMSRSSTAIDKKECKSVPTRRPVRNRIMPVKKDFVYDLSTLLKKDYKEFQDDTQREVPSQTAQPETLQSQPELSASSLSSPITSSTQLPLTQIHVSPVTIDNKTSKRCHVLPPTTDSTENEPQMQKDPTNNISQQPQSPPSPPPQQPQQHTSQKPESVFIQNVNDNNSIKGAADAMAELAVKASKAAFFKSPELPTERPLTMPQRQFDSGTMKDWPVLKSPSAILVSYKSKFPNLKVPGLKRKKRSCLLKNHKNRLHDKHNKIEANGTHIDTQNKGAEQKVPDKMKISSKLVDKIQMQCAQIETDTTKAIQSNKEPHSVATANEQAESAQTTTPRRMTLLERLAENKTKKLNESLSRMTIANSDNESDDD